MGFSDPEPIKIIKKRKVSHIDWSPPPLSGFGQEFLEKVFTDAIKCSVGENSQDVQYDQILDCLRNNSSIRDKVDEKAMAAFVLQIYNKVIDAMNKKSAQNHVTQSQDVSELACTYATSMKPAQVVAQYQDVSELACSYAALILHDAGIAITSEKIATLVKAANVTVESYWPRLCAKLAEKMNIKDLIAIVGLGSSGGAPVAGASTGGAAPADHIGEGSPAED